MPQMQVKNNILFPFMKMHGLGNDFVVIDARAQSLEMTESLARALGDRHRGVGFDQLAVILRTDSIADAYLKFYNSDGSTAGACGNATRCIARYLMDETGDELLSLETEHGILSAKDMGDQISAINMGHPDLNWQEIPLSQNIDTLELPIDGSPTATGMGNPHCTFFVGDVDAIDLETQGPAFEHHPFYPERTNVQFAQVVGTDHIRMRVWERGVGVTLASGSSSCATAVAAARRGLTGRTVRIDLDGGTLHIDWRDDGVWMTGGTMHVFSGTLTQSFLDSLQ